MSQRPIQVFVSYSRQDQNYLEKGSLLGFLRGLENTAMASFWIDKRRLTAGEDWDAEIRAEIERSEIALVLVSQAFLDSDYCDQVEIPGILEQSRRKGLVIMPILLSQCSWQEHEWITSRQVLPGDGNIESDYRDLGRRKELFPTLREALKLNIERRRQAAPTAAQRQAARRLVTALQCELVAAPGAPLLDLEEHAEVADKFHDLVQSTVHGLAHDSLGEVEQPMEREGNALVTYFGYPQARGNDARQAVHTALELLDRVAVESWWPRRDRRLAARIGVHTDWMAVSDEGPLGPARDRVWEVRNAAAPDTVRVSAETYQLVRGFFTCEAAGDGHYRVRQPGGANNRFDLAVTEGTAVMVGRKRQLEALLMHFDRLRGGAGGAVAITGESGLGKSRLVRRLTEDMAAEDVTWLIGRGSRDSQQSAFSLVRDLLEDLFDFVPVDPPAAKLEKLEEGMRSYGLDSEGGVPLLGQLLSIPPEAGYVALDDSPLRQQERVRELVAALLLKLAARDRPLVLVTEDVNWIDSSSRTLLEHILARHRNAPMLVVMTCTPEFLDEWQPAADVARIGLERLAGDEVLELIHHLSDSHSLRPELEREIIARAEGLPLHAEELTRMVLESDAVRGDGSDAVPDLPATLAETLIRRFERLSAGAREVLQLGAVLGRQFSFELLDEVSPLSAAELAPALAELVDRGLLYKSGTPPRSAYLFKHPLLRDAAYRWPLAGARQEHHLRIAEVLAERRSTRERQPELLAHHFTAGGRLEEGAKNWLRAGRAAWEQLAAAEAKDHLGKGLELVRDERFPPAGDPRALELQLLTTLGQVQIATEGHASSGVEETFLRSRKLVRPELFEVTWGLWTCYLVRADLDRAYETAQELIRLAEMAQNPILELEAQSAAGQTKSGSGDNALALEHLGKALRIADENPGESRHLITLQDPEVAAASFATVTAWLTGDTEQALDYRRRALDRAKSLGQPFTLAFALHFSILLSQFLGETGEVHAAAAELVSLSEEKSFPLWATAGRIMLGWAEATRSGAAPKDVLARMRTALADYRRTGARLAQSFYYSLLIDVCRRCGELGQAKATLEEAFKASEGTSERFWHAELHRLSGELTLATAPDAEESAEKDFRSALELASQQGAVALEERAAASLRRLGRPPAAVAAAAP